LFGRLADVAGWRERTIAPTLQSLSALKARLAEDDPRLGDALCGKGVRAALDKAIVVGDALLEGVAEVAFMPPMSGG
jgi:molybdopterin converting factor small subunit